MESDVTQSALFYKLWAWGDKNRKQLLYGFIALVVVGVVVAFWLAHATEIQNEANNALSKVVNQNGVASTTTVISPDSLLKVAADYPDTDAAQRAVLFAAASLYANGKYDAALPQFQKFLDQYKGSIFAGQAALGVATCYDSLGKTNDAIPAYQSVIDRYPTQNVASQAKLNMGRLLAAQGKYKEARSAFLDLSRSRAGTMGSEAVALLEALNAAHPELQPTNSAAKGGVPGLNLK